jgi:hypothetical protein
MASLLQAVAGSPLFSPTGRAAVLCVLPAGLMPVGRCDVVREVPTGDVGGFVAPVPGVADGLADVVPIVDPPVANNPAEVLDVEVVFFVVVLAVERVLGAGVRRAVVLGAVVLVAARLVPVPGLGCPSAELADPLGVRAGAETGAGGTPTVPAPADEGLHPPIASKQMAAPTTSPGIARCSANKWWRIQLLDNFGTDGRRKLTRRAGVDRIRGRR